MHLSPAPLAPATAARKPRRHLYIILVLLVVAALAYVAAKVGVSGSRGLPDRANRGMLIAFYTVSLAMNVLELVLAVVYLPRHLRAVRRAGVLGQINSDEAPAAATGKSSEKKGYASLMRLLRMSKPETMMLSVGMVALIVASASFVAGPLFFGMVINAAANNHSTEDLKWATLWLGLIYAVPCTHAT